MILKEAVAYLINDGVYSCGKDLKAELHLYNALHSGTQEGVDRARQLNPEWTEERLRAYANDGSFGQTMIYRDYP